VTAPEPSQAMPGTPSVALDPDVLDGLREALDDVSGQFIAGLLAVYESEAVALMGQLTAAADEGDTQRLRFAAHSLKGSSANVGGNRLADLCAELEHWTGSPGAVLPRVATIRIELAVLLHELRGFLRR